MPSPARSGAPTTCVQPILCPFVSAEVLLSKYWRAAPRERTFFSHTRSHSQMPFAPPTAPSRPTLHPAHLRVTPLLENEISPCFRDAAHPSPLVSSVPCHEPPPSSRPSPPPPSSIRTPPLSRGSLSPPSPVRSCGAEHLPTHLSTHARKTRFPPDVDDGGTVRNSRDPMRGASHSLYLVAHPPPLPVRAPHTCASLPLRPGRGLKI